MLPERQGTTSSVFSGTRASYVALAAISTLAIALLSSIWEADVSGSIALLGLLAVYLASSELLLLYLVFTPASLIVDIIRLSVVPHYLGGRAWLIFFSILEMLCKVVGTLFAWSVHRSISSGDGGYATVGGGPQAPNSSMYNRVEDPFAAAYAAPRNYSGQGSVQAPSPAQQSQQGSAYSAPAAQPPLAETPLV